jgi:thioredoxin reductase (NADPH)
MPGLTPAIEIPDKRFDLLVVGLGPAGMACALQAHRDGLDVLAVGDESIGGLVRAARRLKNLPGQPGVSGAELAQKMAGQVEALGLPVTAGHVVSLNRDPDGYTAWLTDQGRIQARTVCLATGTRPRDWNLSVGGQPVHRDARSLPDSLAGSRVAVIGGGEAALDTALNCRDRGGEVMVLARGEQLRAVSGLIDEAGEAGVKIRTEIMVSRVSGGPGEWSLSCSPGGELTADLLMVCIGRQPRDELLQELLPKDIPPDVVQTEAPGLFLGGDLIRARDRYVATAMGDGQRVAIAAAVYLQEVHR